MTEERRLTVRFGENEISDPRLRAQVTYPPNSVATATVIVPYELISTANIDYGSPIKIITNVDGEVHQLFTGLVSLSKLSREVVEADQRTT